MTKPKNITEVEEEFDKKFLLTMESFFDFEDADTIKKFYHQSLTSILQSLKGEEKSWRDFMTTHGSATDLADGYDKATQSHNERIEEAMK